MMINDDIIRGGDSSPFYDETDSNSIIDALNEQFSEGSPLLLNNMSFPLALSGSASA